MKERQRRRRQRVRLLIINAKVRTRQASKQTSDLGNADRRSVSPNGAIIVGRRSERPRARVEVVVVVLVYLDV